MNLAQTPPAHWIGLDSTVADIDRIVAFLTERGTFRFPSLPNGLFSAALGEDGDFAQTGYANIWVRDNVHIAHAHWVIGDKAAAVKTARALLSFYGKHQHRFVDIIEGRADANDPMQRPHIRFRGDLTELPEKWSHAQNDALGYWLWLTSKLAYAGDLVLDRDDVSVLVLLLRYWEKIKYWQDEDSGHWEEVRKVSASSIGVVVGSLLSFNSWFAQRGGSDLCDAAPEVSRLASELCRAGIQTLARTLPHECRASEPVSTPAGSPLPRGEGLGVRVESQDDSRSCSQAREYDSALLFLHYPIQLGEELPGSRILDNVRNQLMGQHGIRRYLGDSYWCADYKSLLKADERTADFSDNLEARDQLLKPGLEAQWCIFDPILSVIYGQKPDRELQRFHLQRSLSQLTTDESRFGAYRCPESYFCEAGKYVPNDITPLLWTQANLRLALHFMRQTLADEESRVGPAVAP